MMTQDDDLEAPAQLVAAFKSLPSEKIFVPRSVDQAVLLAARRQLSGQVRQRSPWWRWRLWVAASAVAVALVVLPRLMNNRPQPSLGRSAKSEDVNRDGQIDILD